MEPELLIDGAHTADDFAAASERVIAACVAALWARRVPLEACLLKPQMVVQVGRALRWGGTCRLCHPNLLEEPDIGCDPA